LGEDKGTVMKKVSEKIDEMKNLSDEQKDKDKKILESIIDFKDKIYQKGKIEGNTFLQNKKLNLSEEQKKAFIGNLDYRWIIALY
jgi:hypothetical protein